MRCDDIHERVEGMYERGEARDEDKDDADDDAGRTRARGDDGCGADWTVQGEE